jgi:uncharacterized protein YcbX
MVSTTGSVLALWRYPVKSMQGVEVDSIDVGTACIEGDRRWALVDVASGRVLSAKRTQELLQASATGDSIVLPDGTRVPLDSRADEVLSAWLGRPVTLRAAASSEDLSYQMTFDPPDDNAEFYDIPIPPGTFLDLSPVHLVTTATLHGCAHLRPDLDWDVRRFRPNLVLAVDGDPFLEDRWTGRQLRVGNVVLQIAQPTVRCAMPLRRQPRMGPTKPGLERQPELFQAISTLNEAAPNHLGVYADVVTTGVIHVNDEVVVFDPAGPVG